MMSAHDVAVAALTEAATIARIESQPAEPTTLTGATADGIAKGMSNPEPPSQAGNSQKTLELPAISSNDSQTTTADVNTPPTSDGFSQSQESKKQDQISQHPAVQSSNNSSQSDGLYSPRLEATNAGQKRTHDGLTKSSSPERPSTAYDGKYSRDTSSTSIILSRASPRELTSELRTRLSYAMVKVSKGWESLPIDEVESLASQLGSPTSSNSTLHGRKSSLASPRTAIASLQGLSYGSPTNNYRSNSHSTIDPVLYGDARPSRTYESFWREQNYRRPAPPGSTYPPSGQHVLAPAPDIVSARSLEYNPRPSEPMKYAKPPVLQTTTNLSQSSNGSDIQSTPLTPGRGHPTDAILQTPTQKSIQEQDAIETLLFMSSPGHSSLGQAFPQPQGQTSQAQSPLRTEFGGPLRSAQSRRVEFSESQRLPPESPNPGRRRRPLSGAGQLRDDEFHKMLDSMPDHDDDSTDDDEIEIPITPKRFATSRV